MTLRRIEFPDDLDSKVAKLAEGCRAPIDQEYVRLTRVGLRSQRSWAKRWGSRAVSSFFTAIVVTLVFPFLAAPIARFPEGLLSVSEVLGRFIVWLGLVFEKLFPWPFTVIIVAALLLGNPWGLPNLLDLFSLFRKFKLFRRWRAS
jgi:hypothetical protein